MFSLDTSRHQSVFNAVEFAKAGHVVGIVGCGSLGSALALQLAKLGIGSRMRLFDFDNVEPHNLANQVLFGPEDIGIAKVISAERILTKLTGDTPVIFNRKVEKRNDIEDVTHLFVCVDSMTTRKTIFEKIVWLNPSISYFADGRIGAREALTYSFNPRDLSKSKQYKALWYPDEEVEKEVGGCGFSLSIGATAMMAACLMTWNFINYVSKTNENGNKLFEEIAVRFDNMTVYSKTML